MKIINLGITFALFGFLQAPTFALENTALTTAVIEQETGIKGTMQDGGVFQVSYPRKDLHPIVAGGHMKPPLGITPSGSFLEAGAPTHSLCAIRLLQNN